VQSPKRDVRIDLRFLPVTAAALVPIVLVLAVVACGNDNSAAEESLG
jgi:hypothetical protein